MKAYHIDRTCRLQENTLINYHNIADIVGGDVGELIKELHPNGLSMHGVTYVASIPDKITDPNYPIEAVLEYERVLNFSEQPSRFRSIFACDTLDNVVLWIDRLKLDENQINVWEIEFDHSNFSLLDASLIDFWNKPLSFAAAQARKYWSGEFSSNPLPELIVELPVKMIRKVSL